MYVPVTSSPPSPQAQELGERLFRLTEEYLEAQPGLSQHEVSQAFELARSRLRPGAGARTSLWIVLVGLGATVGAALMVLFARGTPGNWPVLAVVVAVGLVALGVAALAAARTRGPEAQRLIIAVLVGLLLLGVGVALFLSSGGSIPPLG
jgi:VIT1/CCC1 family predicted Fe2+/Mn2+ transporter